VTHPFQWFAIAHDTNVPVIERLATEMGMVATDDAAETSYKLTVTPVVRLWEQPLQESARSPV